MPRRPRFVLPPEGAFHVGARGVDGTPIYCDDHDRRLFLDLLVDAVRRFEWRCEALCLMTNHYHLVLATTRDRLSRGFHRLNGLHARRFNERHRRTGHLFGDRFWSFEISTEEHLGAVCRYVIANPVRAGLCDDVADWPWSACRTGIASN